MNKQSNNPTSLIKALERLAVHDHLCLIYETREEQFAAIIPYMKIGLLRGQKCVYIADDNTAAAVVDALRSGGVDVETALKSGALSIITKKEAYLKEGYFDPDLMIRLLRETTDAAKRAGFPSVRATGEMTWALGAETGVERLMEYEAKLNSVLPEMDLTAICQYNRSRFKPEIIRDVIRTHPLVIHGEQVCKNPYYIPTEEFLRPEQVSREVERLLGNIADREKAERRLAESEARYRSLFESSSDAILLTTPDGSILSANSAACRMFGRTESELQAGGRDSVVDTTDPRLHAAMKERARTGAFRGELLLLRKDGTRFPAEISTSVFMYQGGQYRTSMIIRDLSGQKQSEQMLREGEEKYRALIETTDTGYVILDAKGAVLEANPEYVRLTGHAGLADIVGRNVTEWTAEEDRERNAREVAACREHGFVRNLEINYSSPDGARIPIEINATTIPGATGWKILSLCRDITDRKRAEDRLKKITECFLSFGTNPLENINRLTALCGELLGAACALYNRMEGGMLCSLGQWNAPPGFEPRDKPEGHICYDVIQRGEDDLFVARDLQNSPYGATDPNVKRYDLKTYVGKAVMFAGSPVGSLCVVFQKDFAPDESDRKVITILAAAVGIEERRRSAEEALRKSEDFNRNILGSVDEGFIVIDREYKILSANRSYCARLKTTPEAAAGRYCYELSHHLNKPCYEAGEDCAVKHTFETGKPYAALHTHYDAQGEPVYVEIKSYPLMFDGAGNIVSAIETINDVTSKKKLEEQLRHSQKMEAVGTLAGGIAHDFNNILSAIIGYGSLMEMKMPAADPLRANVVHILESANRAAHLTQGLLAFSRKQIIAMQPVDLNAVMKRVEKLLARIIGEDVSLTVSQHNGALNALADSGQLEQVLMNLATNARDAMPSGGALSISLAPFALDEGFIGKHGYGKPGSYALISVTDTGCGIDAAQVDKIFEPFFTTKEVGKGTGLGLAIAYGIVKQHNGYINVKSERNRGATFSIYLPLINAEVRRETQPQPELPVGGTETLLVAEDDDSLRNFISAVLKEFGYRVIEARDGEEAVRKFRENRDTIRLAVLDVVMPRMNGKTAAEAMVKIDPRMKILFQSGYPADSMHKKGLLCETENFLCKPVSPQVLLKRVRAILDS